MSYFDGIIPNPCAACFSWDGQKWVQTDPGLCDECDYMLEMFPLLNGDQDSQRKKWDLLTILDTPEWTHNGAEP